MHCAEGVQEEGDTSNGAVALDKHVRLRYVARRIHVQEHAAVNINLCCVKCMLVLVDVAPYCSQSP